MGPDSGQPTSGPSSTAPNPTGEADWTDEIADRIEQTVGNLRRIVVDPVRKITRGVVFGTLAIGFAVPAVFMLLVLVFRLLVVAANEALPGPDDNAWMAWDLLGLILVLVGMWLFARRNAKPDTRD
jgi:hypothetical protein